MSEKKNQKEEVKVAENTAPEQNTENEAETPATEQKPCVWDRMIAFAEGRKLKMEETSKKKEQAKADKDAKKAEKKGLSTGKIVAGAAIGFGVAKVVGGVLQRCLNTYMCQGDSTEEVQTDSVPVPDASPTETTSESGN